jgi:hypothetical protein
MKTTFMKTTIIRLLLILPLLYGATTSYAAGRFAGRFTGEGLKFEVQGDQGNYAGTITLGGNAFKFTASEKGTDLLGSFETQDGKFDFKAVLKGDSLSLTTGGSRHKLGRVNTNPLAKSDDSAKKLKSVGVSFFHHFVDAAASGDGNIGQTAKNSAIDTLVSGVQGQPGQTDTTQVANSAGSPASQIASAQASDSAGPAPSGEPAPEDTPQTADASAGSGQGSAAQTDHTGRQFQGRPSPDTTGPGNRTAARRSTGQPFIRRASNSP